MRIILIVAVLRFESIAMDCGSPPLPPLTHVKDGANFSIFAERYEEYSVIRYECDSESHELVGNSTLRCFNGQWVGIRPKCGIYLLKQKTFYLLKIIDLVIDSHSNEIIDQKVW